MMVGSPTHLKKYAQVKWDHETPSNPTRGDKKIFEITTYRLGSVGYGAPRNAH